MTTYTPRPHGEYLEWIDEEIAKVENQLDAIELYLDDPKRPYAIRPSEATRLTDWTLKVLKRSLLANRAGLERHKSRPFNWTTDQAIGMFSEAFPEPPQLPRCVTCQFKNFPCPTYTDITKHLDLVMGER